MRLPDGILMREESLADAVADHRDVAAVEVFDFGEEPALVDGGVDEPQVVRGHANEEGVAHVLALVPGGDGRQAEIRHFAKQLHRNRLADGHWSLMAMASS